MLMEKDKHLLIVFHGEGKNNNEYTQVAYKFYIMVQHATHAQTF